MVTFNYFSEKTRKMQVVFFFVFVTILFVPGLTEAGIKEGCYCTQENGVGSTKFDTATESNCASKSAPVYGTCVWYAKNAGFDPNKKNGCYCSESGTEQSEVDVSNVPGFLSVINKSQCQNSSKNIDTITGGLDYHYCVWYQDDIKTATWKAGAEINVNKKNGCYCNKNGELAKTISDYEKCGISAANSSLGYDSCLWYDNDQLIKTFTEANVGKCVAVGGNYCGDFDKTDCPIQSLICKLEGDNCVNADGLKFACNNLPFDDCNSKFNLCTWQSAGTDVNVPVPDKGPQVLPKKSGSDFDATVLNKLGTTNLQVYAGRIIKGIMGTLGSLALVMFVYSGILFMTDRGSGENASKAKEIIVWTSFGLMLIFASYAILNFVLQIFGK